MPCGSSGSRIGTLHEDCIGQCEPQPPNEGKGSVPSRYLRTIELIIWPLSSSTRYLFPLSAIKPSWPCAMYSRVTIRYMRPPLTRLMGSPSTSWGVDCPELDCSRLVMDDDAEPDLRGEDVPLIAGEPVGVDAPLFPDASCRSHTPNTRWPAGRRESQETRNPEMTGKRLGCVSHDLRRLRCVLSHTLLARARFPATLLALPRSFHRLVQVRQWDLRRAKFLGCRRVSPDLN